MDIHARTDRLAQLLEERLDVRGSSFEAKLRRAGRLLPRHLRVKGKMLVDAKARSGHPRLLAQLDEAKLDLAATDIERYLLKVDQWDRRRGVAVNLSAEVMFRVLVVAALVVAVLIWRGLL